MSINLVPCKEGEILGVFGLLFQLELPDDTASSCSSKFARLGRLTQLSQMLLLGENDEVKMQYAVRFLQHISTISPSP